MSLLQVGQIACELRCESTEDPVASSGDAVQAVDSEPLRRLLDEAGKRIRAILNEHPKAIDVHPEDAHQLIGEAYSIASALGDVLDRLAYGLSRQVLYQRLTVVSGEGDPLSTVTACCAQLESASAALGQAYDDLSAAQTTISPVVAQAGEDAQQRGSEG
jgi:hypothetical protein